MTATQETDMLTRHETLTLNTELSRITTDLHAAIHLLVQNRDPLYIESVLRGLAYRLSGAAKPLRRCQAEIDQLPAPITP
jgi:hypothetical protein